MSVVDVAGVVKQDIYLVLFIAKETT